jgi:hypothetical protein
MAVWPHRPWPPLFIAGVASIAAAFVNPYGPWLFAYPFDRTVASAFSPEIIEWRSPDFRVPDLWIARAILAGALIVIAWPRRKGDPFVTLVAAGWTFVALGSVRFLPIGSAMLVVALAAALGPAVAGRLATTGDGAQAAGPPFGAAIPLLTAAVVSIIAVVVGWSFIAPSSQSAAIAHRMPVAAVEALEAGECPGRVLPAYDWAGFVNHATGRAVGAYGNSAEAPLVAQAAVELVTTDPRPWLDSHRVDVALMPATGPLSHWLDEASDWRVAYRDSQATIHVRAGRDDC